MNIYPWQQTQWQHLQMQQRQQHLPHALLLTGPQGLGQFAFAKAFADWLLCDAAPQVDSACGQCRGCQLIKAESHPDLFIVTPEEKSKVIKIDQIRRLATQLTTTSQRQGYQIAIIYPAEQMNRAAANALLKTLEEPPGKVLLMLVSYQMSRLPATIISRCQKINFTAANDAVALTWLQQQLNGNNNAELLLRIAQFAPLQALHLAQTNYLLLRNVVLKHFIALQAGQADPIAPVAEWLKQDLESLFHVLYTLITDMVRLQLGVQQNHLINQDCVPALQQLIHKLPLIPVQHWLTKLQKAQQLLQDSTHVNIQLLLEDMLLEWSHMNAG